MSWGAPQRFQGQQGAYGQPAAPRAQYGAPAAAGQHGVQPGQYGAPAGQYGAPAGQYGAPAGQFGAQRPPGHGPPAQGGYGAAPPPAAAQYRPPPPQQAPGHYGAPATAPPPYNPAAGYPGGQPAGYAPPPGPPPGISPDLWNWFQAVDADRSGKITAAELQRALHNGNWTPFNQETCRLMIGMFDKDKNGTIDIKEFSALWKYIQDWKACFDRFDTDRSGNISANELMNAFRSFGYNLSMNFVNICMRTYDRRSTGNINFDDFIQCCVMLKALTDKFREKDTNQGGTIKIHYEEFLRMVLDNSIIM